MAKREVYLDYQSTTPCDPRVSEVILSTLASTPGNSSSQHQFGSRARRAISLASEQVAELLGALPEELVFTSGATESNNMAILGLCRRPPARRAKIVTTAVEHSSVLEPCRAAQALGYKVEICPVKRDGSVDIAALASLVDSDTLLLSVQLVSNELGTIQPLREIVDIARSAGCLTHTDASQAIGRVPIDVVDLGCDLLSISGHKFYGPKGIGCLYVASSGAMNLLEPLLYGGGHQKSLRPGTLDPAYIAGMGVASELAAQDLATEPTRLSGLRDRLENLITSGLEGVRRNGAIASRVPSASSLTLADVDADALCANLPDVAISAGSACSSRTPQPSHVLRAIGIPDSLAYQTVRLSVGRMTTAADIEYASKRIVDVAQQIRSSG